MIATDVITCFGHENVLAKHRTTLEITRENFLTKRGDCIICINSDKGALHLSNEVKDILRNEGYGYLVIMKDGFMDMVMGRGSRDLPFSSDIKMIVRKSDFISDGTILIKANKSARDLRRDLIPRLRQGEIKVLLVASQDPLHDDEILRIVVNLFPSFLNSSQLVQDHGS
ncbi:MULTISPECIES: DUF371 domain-containing protein [Metallosphaera]|uniref:DUF371 domain-containing protein n=3 Tax=Metallosphaera TaxID=41980 RepID=A4YER8_METS5|nr:MULTISPECIES: DUF371 domain-containing protein [Metallosphaera]ABP94920.1 protein of unknown function DUF371 [Metallosphaera sedula DSM 5348]AIM26907.1 protein of unknown function DUF371 [Metallosphaera sedula]MCH1771744.1 DUF371 domain-containing protein [Metallosphaera sedula]MCP6728342.1 DUF371 domain-containing protein [Metallosphaera sedula]MCY0861745.1 DUF371 domain-containing protein [Metallosphaera prunae]